MERSYNFSVGAKRLANVQPSAIRKVLEKAVKLQGEGHHVIFFSIGEPDFNTPEAIKSATIQAIKDNFTHYTSNRGHAGLRKSLQNYIYGETGVSYDPETEIILTSGGAEGLNNVMLSFVDEGDDVIVLTPFFVNYKMLVNMCGANFIDVPLDDKEGFKLNIATLEKAITPKAKMLIINNPNNPSGVVFSKAELNAVCEMAKKYNFLVLSDEMYSRLTYGAAKFYSMAAFPNMKERTIIVSGFSKTFAMTGWRVGYLAAAKPLADVLIRTHQYSTTSGTTFIHVGLTKSMDSEETKVDVEHMVNTFGKRRALMLQKLSEIPGISYSNPAGAFYLLMNVAASGLSGEAFSERLLAEKHLATVPAKAFGDNFADYIRISYATSESDIEEGVRRIKELVKELKDGKN